MFLSYLLISLVILFPVHCGHILFPSVSLFALNEVIRNHFRNKWCFTCSYVEVSSVAVRPWEIGFLQLSSTSSHSCFVDDKNTNTIWKVGGSSHNVESKKRRNLATFLQPTRLCKAKKLTAVLPVDIKFLQKK